MTKVRLKRAIDIESWIEDDKHYSAQRKNCKESNIPLSIKLSKRHSATLKTRNDLLNHLYANLFCPTAEKLVGDITEDPEPDEFPSRHPKGFFLNTGEKDTEITTLIVCGCNYKDLTNFVKRAEACEVPTLENCMVSEMQTKNLLEITEEITAERKKAEKR
jgi:hypothetical protein